MSQPVEKHDQAGAPAERVGAEMVAVRPRKHPRGQLSRETFAGRQSENHEECCKITTIVCPCPICGNAGRKVTSLTLDNHVPSSLREEIGDDVAFCLNPDCDVVYCNPAGKVVRKGQTRLPVTIKDPGDEVFVCYCFEHKRGDLRAKLKEKGMTDIPDRIRQGVKEGRCDCERKNPQGACCLGNVAGAIKAIQAEVKPA